MLIASNAKTLGGYLRPLKTDFKDLKGKNGHSPMYSSTFGGKIQKQDFRVSNSLYLGMGSKKKINGLVH